jgi:hypothetical protein
MLDQFAQNSGPRRYRHFVHDASQESLYRIRTNLHAYGNFFTCQSQRQVGHSFFLAIGQPKLPRYGWHVRPFLLCMIHFNQYTGHSWRSLTPLFEHCERLSGHNLRSSLRCVGGIFSVNQHCKNCRGARTIAQLLATSVYRGTQNSRGFRIVKNGPVLPVQQKQPACVCRNGLGVVLARFKVGHGWPLFRGRQISGRFVNQ